MRITHALRWSYGSMAAGLVAQLAFAAVLARLLPPQAYGLLAVANGLLNGLTALADLGIGSVVVREQKLEAGDLWALALVGLAANLLIMVGLWLAAPWLAGQFSMSPEGPAVLRAMAALLPLYGLNGAALAWLRRDLDFRWLGLLTLAGLLLGQGMTAVALAWAGFGVWALVAGALVQTVVAMTLGLWRHPPHRPNWARLGAMLRLGAGFSVLRLLDATQAQMAPLVVAACVGTVAAGLYDRSFVFSVVLFELATGALGRVLFPFYGRLAQEGAERVADGFHTALRLCLCLLCPVAAVMALAADPLIATLLGAGWLEAVAPLRLLLIMAVMRVVAQLSGGLVEARGRIGLHGGQRLLVLAGLALWLMGAVPHDLTAVLIGFGVAETASALMLLALAAQAAGRDFTWGLRPLAAGGVTALPVAAGVALLLPMLDGPSWVRLAVVIPAAAVLLAATLWLHPLKAVRDEVRRYLLGLICQ